jgi:hypothetical protein
MGVRTEVASESRSRDRIEDIDLGFLPGNLTRSTAASSRAIYYLRLINLEWRNENRMISPTIAASFLNFRGPFAH